MELPATSRSPSSSAKFHATLRSIVGVPLAVALVFGVLLVWQIATSISTLHWVDHTDLVLSTTARLYRNVVDGETGTRGFLITRDERYVEPLSRSRQRIPVLLGELRHLVSDNSAQSARVAEISTDIETLHAIEDALLVRARANAELGTLDAHDNAKLHMDRLRDRFNLVSNVESALREERLRNANNTSRVLYALSIGASIATGLFLAWFGRQRLVSVARAFDHALASVRQQSEQLAEAAEERKRLLAEERAARAEAERANGAKDEFLATVSHELRTPLTAILGWARLAREPSLGPEKRERAIETIERNAATQARLVEDLLDVSRIVAGKLRLDVHPFEPVDAVRAAIDSVQPAADARNIRIQATLDPNAGPLLGDVDRFQQIAWNLLSNAVKFTPKGGRVLVRLNRNESNVELIVEDTGIGIAPEFLPFVFERFRQADPSPQRVHQGLGLGLSIVRHLVELHGGTVRVNSDGEGKGTRFVVTVPISPVQSAAKRIERIAPTAPNAAAIVPIDLRRVSILVVDDEPDTRDLLVGIASHAGASVTPAASVADALLALERTRFDVVVSDIGMPGEDGYALIAKVRALPSDRGGRLPVVALTAYARVEDRTRALRAGFTMHLAKPIDPSELLTILAHVTGRNVPGAMAERETN